MIKINEPNNYGGFLGAFRDFRKAMINFQKAAR
jgi:Tfp pilus assembly protein PilF